jgi:hypothetical protein
MIIDIDYKQMVKFLGRNGMANQSGISVSLTEADGIVTLQPFTGKGNIGKGFLEIPPDAIPAVIAALQKMLPSPVDTLVAKFNERFPPSAPNKI